MSVHGDVRMFTPEEARALVPRVRPILAELRNAFHEYRFAREQLDELLGVYREDPERVPGHPMANEARAWRQRADSADQRVRAAIDDVATLGGDVKDPILGLVDFRAQRRNGEIVLLCYRDDEDTIAYWHPLETGYTGRRPLSEL